jgi:hypothetical protein
MDFGDNSARLTGVAKLLFEFAFAPEPHSPMQKLPLLVAVVATAGAAAAQNPRTPVKVDTATLAEVPDVASNGDLSAILYQDQATEGLFVTTSDGRGIDWNAPVRIDDKVGTTRNFIDTRETLKISNGNIFACWSDERNSADDDVYFTYSTDGGATWAANIEVDKGFPSGGNPVREYAFDVDGENGAILIATDNGDEELYMVVSTSMSTGALSAAIPVTTLNGSGDTDAIAIDVDGDLVHMAYLHDASGMNQTYYSVYDLSSSTFVTHDLTVSLNALTAGGSSAFGLSLHADGDISVIAWDVDGINGSDDELWVKVMHPQHNFGDIQVGQYPLGGADVDNSDCMVNGDIIIVTWEDNRTGSDEAYVISADVSGGTLVFSPDVSVSSGGAGFPAIDGGGDYIAITASAGGFPENAQAVVSHDGGLTFGSTFDAASTVGDVDFTELAYNEKYGNFIISFLDDTNGSNECYAGGFRSQSVSAVGTFSAGSPINFDVDGFGMSEDGNFFGVLASGSLGSQMLPDGRNLGLTMDLFFNRTRAGIPGNFSGTLAGGAGSTPTLNLPPLAPGTTIYFAAVGFTSLSSLFSVTDVQSVVTL